MEAVKKKTPIDCSFIPYKDDKEEPSLMPEIDISDVNISLVDTFVNVKVIPPQGKEPERYEGSNLVKAKVIRYFCDQDGLCNANIWPQLNALMYEVEFPDGEMKPYAANVIAENIWSQVDPEGQRYVIFESMIGHHVNNSIAVSK